MKRPSISRTIVYLGMAACLAVVMTASDIPAIEQTPPAPTPPPGHSEVPDVSCSDLAAAAAGVNEPAVKLYMPDGQLKSHMIRVYVSGNIQPAQKPLLCLLRSHVVTKKAVGEDKALEPALVAPGQEWIESAEGTEVRRTGTLLLFDLNKMSGFGLKAMLRVRPVVHWTEGGTGRLAVGASEVNVANIVADICWTGAIVGFALLVVIGLSWRASRNPILLLSGVDGHLSLAQTQVACWTVAVGSVVLGYGLIRLEIPTIPTSLLVLMGASLTTGGLGYFKDARNQKKAVKEGATPIRRALEWGDLVRVFKAGQEPELSLAKAQMLFWTLLLLVLFISKSIFEGAIWEVPWPLVALMGFSQAGYLAPKMVEQTDKS